MALCWVVVTGSISAESPRSLEASAEAWDSSGWQLDSMVTTVDFDHDTLARFGISMHRVEATGTASPHSQSVERHGVAFASAEQMTLRALGSIGAIRRFEGAVPHLGGFELRREGVTVDLRGFAIQGSPTAPRDLQLVDTSGLPVLRFEMAHLDVVGSRLDLFNMDVAITAELAARLRFPEIAESIVGVASVRARIVEGAQAAAGVECSAPFVGEVDVELTDIPFVGAGYNDATQVSIAPSATLRNVGTSPIAWYQKFSDPAPPYNNDQHPFLVWSVFREIDGALEPLGISDVKHAFSAQNAECECDASQILHVGCEDTYSKSTNESLDHLGPRHEIEAHTALWTSTCSHFDPGCTGEQTHPPGGNETSISHQLVVNSADLVVPGARYYLEAWYLARDDVNLQNSMAHIELMPQQAGTVFFFFRGAFVQGPLVDAWLASAEPGVQTESQTLDLADGRVHLGTRVTDLGDGRWRYDYLLTNFTFDPRLDRFAVPTGGASLDTFVFRNPGLDTVDDWGRSETPVAVEWAVDGDPNRTELDWGTSIRFSFIAQSPPQLSSIELGVADGGALTELQVTALTPDGPLVFEDDFEAGGLSAWTSSSGGS